MKRAEEPQRFAETRAGNGAFVFAELVNGACPLALPLSFELCPLSFPPSPRA